MKSLSYKNLLVCFTLCALTQSAELASVARHHLDDIKTASRTPVKSPGQGGGFGTPFDDVADFNEPDVSPIIGIHAINISYEDFIEAIQITYILANHSLYEAPSRGRSSKPFVVINLESIEHVTELEGMTNGSVVNQLTITTLGPDYERRIYGPFGKPAPNQFSTKGYIIGFHGISESHLTNIGVYSLEEMKKSELFGPGQGGSPFDDETDVLVPPVVRLTALTIWHGDFIDGLQAEYLLLDGAKKLGEIHGGHNSSLTTTLTFQDEEVIELVELRSSDEDDGAYISMLTITVRKEDGKSEVFGPFGRKGEILYFMEGNVFGFYGHSGIYIDKLGFYTI